MVSRSPPPPVVLVGGMAPLTPGMVNNHPTRMRIRPPPVVVVGGFGGWGEYVDLCYVR